MASSAKNRPLPLWEKPKTVCSAPTGVLRLAHSESELRGAIAAVASSHPRRSCRHLRSRQPCHRFAHPPSKMPGTVAAGALVFLTTRPPVSSGRYSRLPCCFNRSVISLCCFITFASRFSPGFPPGAEARVCGPTLLRPVGSNHLPLGIWIGGLRESVDHGQEVVVVALLVGTFLVLADDITPHPLHLVKIPIIVNL